MNPQGWFIKLEYEDVLSIPKEKKEPEHVGVLSSVEIGETT